VNSSRIEISKEKASKQRLISERTSRKLRGTQHSLKHT
jgi:hypothetical protein